MKDKSKHIVFGGRGWGKMMAIEEFMKLLPEDKRKDVIVIKASDPVPELRGNSLAKQPLLLIPSEWYDDETKD